MHVIHYPQGGIRLNEIVMSDRVLPQATSFEWQPKRNSSHVSHVATAIFHLSVNATG